jgi:hypothetical protein
MNLWRIPVTRMVKPRVIPSPSVRPGRRPAPRSSPSGKQHVLRFTREFGHLEGPVDKVTGLSKAPAEPVITTSREDSRGAGPTMRNGLRLTQTATTGT